MVKLLKSHLLILLILLVGLLLRLYQFSNNPTGFFCDEASIGYNAYSLLTTNRDEWGNKFPLFLKAFGEYKNPVMTYSTIPFIALLGLNETSVRLTSVFYGMTGIIAIYLLLKEMISHQAAILGALFLAISPWHIHFSKVSLEGLMAFVFFTTIATYFWIKFFKDQKNNFLCLVSLIFFVCAIYSYFPARIFIPLYSSTLVLIYLKKIIRHPKIILLFCSVIIPLTPLISHILFGPGMARWNQVKGEMKISSLPAKYLNYFSLDYLFLKGDIDYNNQFITRHSFRGLGEIYLFQLPLIIFGVIFLFINRQFKQTKWILISWILLYPFCDLFTESKSPQATRTVIGVIPFQILAVIGTFELYHLFKSRCSKIILSLILITVSVISVRDLVRKINNYPLYSSDFWGWQYGPKPIMQYFLTQKDNYDQLCLEGQFNAPEIFIKFYDPKNTCNNKCQICDYKLFNPKMKQLFAFSNENYNLLIAQGSRIKVKHTIVYPNNQNAFIIGELE